MDKPTNLNIRLLVIYRQRRQGTTLKHRIGLVYVPGELTCFEAFGNLPTDLMRKDVLAGNMPASMNHEMLVEKFKNTHATEFKANNTESERKDKC